MREILTILERDARATPDQIAQMTGIAVETVRERIHEWERSGIIRRYKAVIDWERFGDTSVWAFIDVSVTPQRGTGFDDIAERIYRFPEVRSVFLVSGGHDLRVIVEGAGLKEVASFVSEKLAPLEHVTATDTHFLLKRYKDDGEIYAEAEADHRLMVTP